METRLTLKIEKKIIERAKNYAKAHQISLSELIENYLLDITDKNNKEENITPLVKELTGIISIPKDFDSARSYVSSLANKYK